MRIKNSKEAKNFTWLIFGKIVRLMISLLVSLATARYLGPSNYGLINYGLMYGSFFTSFCTLGITSIIIKDFNDNPEEQGITIGSTIWIREIASIIAVAIIILIVSCVDKGEKITIVVVALCSISLLFQPFDTINYWFQYKYESKVIVGISSIAYFCMAVYKITLLVLNKEIYWFALSSAVDTCVVMPLMLIAYRKYQGPRLKVSLYKVKKMLWNSYHFILSGLMVSVYAYTDRFMLKRMFDETIVGYYSVSYSICMMWTFVLQAIIDVMYPTIMILSENNEKFEKKNRQLYAIVFYISFAVSLFIYIFGGQIIFILYGDKYMPAVNSLKIMTWHTAFSYLGVARNAWIVSNGKQKYLKYMYAVAMLMNIYLNWLLIPNMGASGAAAASLVTQIFTSIILSLCIKGMRPNAKLMIDAILLRNIM